MTPNGEHRVLQDLLAESPLANNEEDLAQHNFAVTPVQLSQRAIVAGRHQPKELGVVPLPVWRVATHRADRQVCAHARYKPLGRTSHDQLSSKKRCQGSPPTNR